MALISYEKTSKAKLSEIYPNYLDLTNPKVLFVDNMYVTSFIVSGYENEMEGGFLEKLLFCGIDMQLSIFIEKQNTNEIIKKLTYQIGNSGADIKSTSENQMDMDVIGKINNEVKYIRKQMQLEGEEFYYIYIYILVYANSMNKLDINIRKIENACSLCGLTIKRANYKHEKVFSSSLPILKNDKLIKKIAKQNVLTDGLSSTYPFISNEFCDEDGIFIGTNSFSNSLIMIDRFNSEKYKNPNMFIIGTSGSGKSYLTKLMVIRNRYFNINQYIVDPDREYIKICQKLRGAIIDFKKSRINVMDIRDTTKEDDNCYLENKIRKT